MALAVGHTHSPDRRGEGAGGCASVIGQETGRLPSAFSLQLTTGQYVIVHPEAFCRREAPESILYPVSMALHQVLAGFDVE